MKRILTFFICIVLLSGIQASAFVKNNLDYVLDGSEKVFIPKTYRQIEVISYINHELAGFQNAKDMFLDSEDNLFICDTGNNRIVKLDREGKLLRVYAGEVDDPFNMPQGVFVDSAGDIYVADTENKRIVMMDADGKYKKIITRPESDLLESMYEFSPTKLAVGSTGYIYTIVGKDFMAIDKNGQFKGFVGATRLGFSLKRLLVNLFATEEQKKKMPKDNPPAYKNFTTDQSGMLVACSTAKTAQIKMLNYLGENIYPSGTYGEIAAYDQYGSALSPSFNDIHINDDGVISLVEQHSGKVYQLDREGNYLAVFGGIGTNRGYFQNPVAIEMDRDGRIYVLDQDANNVQIFSPTPFIKSIHTASTLYFNGKYDESLSHWTDIYKSSGNYPLAGSRIGKILYKQEKYSESLEAYRNADDMKGYSQAYAEIRHDFIRDHLGWITLAALVVVTLFVLGVKKLKNKADRVVRNFYFNQKQ